MTFYRYRSAVGFPVVVCLHRAHAFHWTRVFGVQVGPWFIGAIKGAQDAQTPQPIGGASNQRMSNDHKPLDGIPTPEER